MQFVRPQGSTPGWRWSRQTMPAWRAIWPTTESCWVLAKSLDASHTWFSPVLSGNLLLAAETVGAARRGRHDGATHVRAVAAFDLADGKVKWRNEDAHPLRTVDDGKRGPFTTRAEFKPLSVADSLALVHASSYQFRHGGRIAVLDVDSGRELWHRDFQPKELYTQGSQRAVLRGGEVIVLDGLGVLRFDARTGAAIGEPLKLPKGTKRQARNNGACTASRATVDWLICNAYLYVGPDGDVASCFGARGACGQGVVPANGLTYVNPTPCDCGDYTRGYQAMSSRLPGKPIGGEDRLVRGPAFDEASQWKLALPDSGWPIFLGDAERRSVSAEALPAVALTYYNLHLHFLYRACFWVALVAPCPVDGPCEREGLRVNVEPDDGFPEWWINRKNRQHLRISGLICS